MFNWYSSFISSCLISSHFCSTCHRLPSTKQEHHWPTNTIDHSSNRKKWECKVGIHTFPSIMFKYSNLISSCLFSSHFCSMRHCPHSTKQERHWPTNTINHSGDHQDLGRQYKSSFIFYLLCATDILILFLLACFHPIFSQSTIICHQPNKNAIDQPTPSTTVESAKI